MLSAQQGTEFVIPRYDDIKTGRPYRDDKVVKKKTAEEKKKIVQDRFHMEMEDGLGKELELMCNISDYIEERALLRGREEGRIEGTELERKRGIGILAKALLESQTPKERIIEQMMFNYQLDRETPEEFIEK